MGFFDFLKKKEQYKKISFSEIEEYNSKFEEENSFDDKILEMNEEIKQRISQTKENLESLNNAGLKNENIPERAKHIMQGNKKQYIHKTNHFLAQINLPKTRQETITFSKIFTSELDQLMADTQRSYAVLREFVEKELATVIRSIKGIQELASKQAKEIEDVGFEVVDQVNEKLSELNNQKKTLKVIRKKEKEQTEQLKTLKEKEKKIFSKIEQMKKGSAYKEHLSLKENQEIKLEERQRQEKRIVERFLSIERPLRKYSHTSIHANIILKYLDNAIVAIEHDDSLEIFVVLESMKKGISSLGLKDKQEAKLKKDLENLTKENLISLRGTLIKLKQEEVDIRRKQVQNDSFVRLSEQENILEKINDSIKFEEQELSHLKSSLKQTTPDKIIKQISELFLKINIIIENE